jgi:hypothetical protein
MLQAHLSDHTQEDTQITLGLKMKHYYIHPLLITFLLIMFSIATADLITQSMKRFAAGEDWFVFGVIAPVVLVVIAEIKLRAL